jgi:hypothetical protein
LCVCKPSISAFAAVPVVPSDRKFVPESRRPKAALRLIEAVRVILEGLYLLDESRNVTGKAIILDRDRRLPKMVTVLDPLSYEGRLCCIVEEWCRGRIQGWERRRVKQGLNASVTLSNINNVPVDVIDRAPNKLSEIGS